MLSAANKAAQKIEGLRVVEITDSSQLYTLFVERKLPDGTSVHGKGVVIIDAHGEVLSLPPQHMVDSDHDGMLELNWTGYAEDVRRALPGGAMDLLRVGDLLATPYPLHTNMC